MAEPSTAAARLSREVGLLAGRLARFLRVGEGGMDAHGLAFLDACYEQAAKGAPPARESAEHPLGRLIRTFDLAPADVDVLLLAGMPEEHEGYAAVLRALHPRGEPRPSAGLIAQLLEENGASRPAFHARLVAGALARAGLIRMRGDGPFYEQTVEPAECLWPALHGLDVWPPWTAVSRHEAVRAGLDEWLADGLVNEAVGAIADGGASTVLVTAESAEVAFHRGMALTAAGGAQPVGVLAPAAANPEFELLVGAHAAARGLLPVVEIAEPEGAGMPQVPSFDTYPGPVVICGRRGALPVHGRRPVLIVPAERLSVGAHRKMWSALAPELEPRAAAQLAARYPVEPVYAAQAVCDVRALDTGTVSADRIGAAIQARSSLALAGGVQLVAPTASMPDLVLSDHRMQQIREALNRMLHQHTVLDDWGFLRGRRGARGVRMLFAGPPGTGKTLAAEVMAHELKMELLMVDISRVVSKWIGETEKNLSAVFDTAERARAVLFFDEADALFGKRTEVSDAHDRYANLETAYLLARLERFDGLAILSTNLRQNIDQAFLRRLEFAVNFDEPGREERIALWKVHLPAAAPLAPDVNLRELANLFPVVGALIRNACVAAGFLAASDGGVIRRRHLIHGMRREYEKAGKAFPGLPASVSGNHSGAGRQLEIKEEVWQ